nr:MAG TPA: hypothetical protein [Caudoviricetes sp.]
MAMELIPNQSVLNKSFGVTLSNRTKQNKQQ